MPPQEKDRLRPDIGQRPWRKLLLAGMLTVACFGAGVGDTLYVGRRILPIRSGKFAFDKVVATAQQGDTVKVTGVEGTYLKVLYAQKDNAPIEGYVMEAALTPVAPVIATTRAVTADHDTLVSVAASKGHLDSKEFAKAKNLPVEPLLAMEKESAEVMSDSDAAFTDFMKAGKVGPFKAQQNANR